MPRIALALGLAALFFMVTAPVFLFQDGAGNPDDVAELLPRDTMVFAELVRAPRILKDWQEYVAGVATGEGKKKICEMIEKALTQALDVVPDKLRKDFEKGLPTLQRLAVAVGEAGDEVEWALIATSSDAAFFKDLVEKHLQVFAADERRHPAALVLTLRKVGDLKFPEPVLVAAPGKRLVVTTNARFLYEILDRAAGRGRGEDLRTSPRYRDFSPPPAEDAYLRAFVNVDWSKLMGGGRDFRRSSQHQMDVMNAILDLDRIRGTVLESVLRPGQITTRSRVLIDSPCRLYDAWRQAPGPKETLKFVPGDAALAAHVNLKGGKEFWADVKALIKRGDEIDSRSRGERVRRRTAEEEFKRAMEQSFGFGPDELAEAVGREAAFAFVGDDAFANPRNIEGSILFVLHLADAEKGRALAAKLAAKFGGEPAKEGEAELWIPKEERAPTVGVRGPYAFVAGKADVLRAALKAPAGKNVAQGLPPGAAGASKLVTVNLHPLWALAKEAFRGDTPDLAKDLNLGARSTLLITEEKNALTMTTTDAGIGVVGPAGFLSFPLLFVARGVAMGPGGPPAAVPRKAEAPKADPPKLPADKLAAEVRKHVQDLRAEELAVRDGAAAGLRALGRQAIPLLVEAAKKEADIDARAEVMKILAEWKAYDAFPELVNGKVQSFLQEFEKAFPATGNPDAWNGFAVWPRQQGMSFPWNLEPYNVNTYRLGMMEHREAVEIPLGLKKLAERVGSGKLHVETQRNVAAILAFIDSRAARDEVLAAHASATDPQTKAYLQIALGWAGDEKAREIVLKGFKDPDRYLSRASFLAVERSRDLWYVPALLELLKDPDNEIRWNASYTLRVLTGNRAAVNIYLPEEEFKAAFAGAQAWWEKNRK